MTKQFYRLTKLDSVGSRDFFRLQRIPHEDTMSNAQADFRKTLAGTGKPKRIMKDFEIHEVSAVDHPAQANARATILKRDTTATEPLGFDTFAEAVDFLKARGASGVESMQQARRLFPDLLQKLQGDIPAKPEPKPDPAAAAAHEFTLLVEAIRRDDPSLSRTQAMSEARQRDPALFARYQAA